MSTDNRDEMRERIIEAALKRFSHYSASKTTMNEIADDLHCSKASLYYYFPDKNGLHVAVLEKVAEVYFDEMEKEAAKAPSAEAALMEMINTRHAFVKKFCRLELFKILREKQMMNTAETFQAARLRETEIVTGIIQRGVQSGELQTDEPERVAALYIHSMMGLRMSVLSHNAITDDISEEGFETIHEWQTLLTEIFIKGLKK
jgi:TetR/AcrR family transcriptional repressor of mexJK operon